jgi:Phosphopantetheinyl transferase
MSLFKTIPIDKGLIGIWELSESLNDLLSKASSEELIDPQFVRYTNDKRKSEWLATRILLKEILGGNFSISYHPSGKPVLNHSKFGKISISHSRDFVAVIVHESKEVGIDIENCKRDFERIEKRFLAEEEMQFINSDKQLKCFYWCAKEAIFKLVKEDGIEFKEQIIVTPDTRNDNQYLAKFISPAQSVNYQINYDFFSENYLVWIVE